jgi:hypothetical protein
MVNKWNIEDFKPPKMFWHVCSVCNDLVRVCDKCGRTADDCISFSCGKSQGKGHICYTCWDDLRTGEGENDEYGVID